VAATPVWTVRRRSDTADSYPIQIHMLHFSRWAGRAILCGIVISVFVLYQMRRGQF
jgi:hypothetical protein